MSEEIEATIELVAGGKRHISMQRLALPNIIYSVLERALSALNAEVIESVLEGRQAYANIEAFWRNIPDEFPDDGVWIFWDGGAYVDGFTINEGVVKVPYGYEWGDFKRRYRYCAGPIQMPSLTTGREPK